ncbi:MAG: S4 domain-containing protein [Novosphingobium sp.]|nr:S4 domain-containing protein [Novosphingobium sp.]
MSGESLRLDKLLWFLRLAKTRALAQDRVADGHIRLNGRRVERGAQPIRPGDVLTLPTGERAMAIEIVTLPRRRGPAIEAGACYRTLDACPPIAIAAGETAQTSGDPPP